MGWITEAPRFPIAHIEAATIEFEGKTYPAVAFGFEGTPALEPVSAVFVGREGGLRQLQRELDRAITDSLRKVRAAEKAKP